MAGRFREEAGGREPLDIHERCFKFLYGEYEPDRDLDIAIRKAVYENAIDRYAVLDVLAIALRDELLSQTAATANT